MLIFVAIYVQLFLQLGSTTAFQDFAAAVQESEAKGLVGESVRLPCEVDKESCGPFHSIKWYKENDRVFIFSEIAQVKRPEGSLLERTEFHYAEERKENWLQINPVTAEDEGSYKCEITYLAVKEACSVVQFVHLKTLARPSSFELNFEDGSTMANGSMIGPFLEGEDVSIRCQAGSAKPMPSVKWLNGTEKMQGRFQSDVDENGLFVGSDTIQVTLTRYDLGRKFRCEVFNEAMQTPVELYVQLDIDVAPESVDIVTSDTMVREDDEVTLLCVVKGSKPVALVYWKNGTIPIEQAAGTTANIQKDTVEMKMDDGTFQIKSKLTFRASKFENGVSFSCEAMNEVLEKQNEKALSKEITIDVQYPPSVSVHPVNITVNESMDFILFCDYSANPIQLTHVYWYLDEHQLDIAGRPEKYKNGNVEHPSLLVTNASADDMGEYTCRVSNEVGESEVTSSAGVTIQYRPQVVLLTDPEGPISEELKTNVTLICDVIKAYPETLTRVRWFLDGQLLKELPECDDENVTSALYDDSQFEFCNVDPSRLLLEYVIREFHGNYSCEAMNAAGWSPLSLSVPVVVNYKPGLTLLEYQPSTVIKGQPVILTCNAMDPGRPISTTFRWTRNSLLVPDITTSLWKIDSASLETEANFTCVAFNSEGKGNIANIDINVLAPPTFITRLPTYHGALMNADEVSLTCHVECSPNCTITWLKDNLEFNNDTHFSVRNVYLPPDSDSGDFESVKSILSWKMEQWPEGRLHREVDNANYTCVSSYNSAGDGVSSNTVFRVEYPPEDINISSKLLQVKEDEIPEKIECFTSSYPEATYFWLYGEETVMTGSTLNLGFPVKRNRAGSYTCVAENRHGKKMISTSMDVLFKPECKIDREDVTVDERPAILLICRAYANPEDLSFRWRVGNETLSENVKSSGLESTLTLDAVLSSLGTYYCYVNNSVGESIPCEIDVTGIAGLLQTSVNDNILLYSIIVVIIIIVIAVIILLIIFCRRQQQRGKFTGSESLHKQNPECNINRGPAQPPNLSSISTTSSIASSQLLHKWPLKPGVQVHVNSLTSLADDSKPLFNLNSNTNSTTASTGSYQAHHPYDSSMTSASTLPNNPSHKLVLSHKDPKERSNLLHRNFYPTNGNNKRSSCSSSSSSLSSSNIVNARLSAMHTIPHQPTLDVGTNIGKSKWGAVPIGAKSTSTPKYSHNSTKKARPTTILPDHYPDSHGTSDSEPLKRDNGPNSGKGGKEPRPSSPTNGDPTFYENLPFHGIQEPPNKDLNDENFRQFKQSSSVESRPSSQLSREASSGYGSCRSQIPKVYIKTNSSPTYIMKKSKNGVSFTQDDDQVTEQDSKFEERCSRPYSSMKSSSLRTAKNALSRTAAYLSVRVPRKSSLYLSSQCPESSPTKTIEQKESIIDNENKINTPIVSNERSCKLKHSLKTSKPLHSLIIESTQKSFLTFHAKHLTEMNNNSSQSSTSKSCKSIDQIENTPNQIMGFTNSNKNRQHSLADISLSQGGTGSIPKDTSMIPTPAPRNACNKMKPTYQNIPNPKYPAKISNHRKISYISTNQVHESHNENQNAMNYESSSNVPSTHDYFKDTLSSTESSPSSSYYQQPYNSTQNYHKNSTANFIHYPHQNISDSPNFSPIYPISSQYHNQTSYTTTVGGQYHNELYFPHPNSTKSLISKYHPHVTYTDLTINHNGLPINYSSDGGTDYPVLHFNEHKDQIIGQEIDV